MPAGTGGQRSAECASEAVIGGRDVSVDFTDGADAFGRAPGIFFRGDGFSEACVTFFVVGDFGEEFTAGSGDGGSCCGGGLVLSRGAMREKRDGTN
jgi:hypothetical protein